MISFFIPIVIIVLHTNRFFFVTSKLQYVALFDWIREISPPGICIKRYQLIEKKNDECCKTHVSERYVNGYQFKKL